MVKRKSLLPLLLLCLHAFLSPVCTAKEREKDGEADVIPSETSPGYTINFNNVSIIEYIQFISKISKKNFIYEEQDLSFTVTIVSEEPSSLVDIMAALIQVLRVNGYDLVEQGNNFIISKLGSVKNIPTVVSQDTPIEGTFIPPIMTRVFKIKNANPQSLANIVRPLLSTNAIVEISEETRHLIITDIMQNIEQVHRLFLNLDLPQTPLDINSYTTRNNLPEELAALATQILTPMSEGNPLLFVPQNSTHTLYIVSTPFLTKKAMALFEDLDTPPTLTKHFNTPITGQNILLYHISNKPANVLQDAIKHIENTLIQIGPSSTDLVQTLQSMKYIRESHSLLFIGDPVPLQETHTLLQGLDIPYTKQDIEQATNEFYIYKIMHGDEPQIARTLETIVENLKTSPQSNQDFIKTINSMKWIKESDSLLFTGNQHSIEQLKQLLPTIDIPLHHAKTASKIPLSNKFYSYTPIYETPEELLQQIQEYYNSLKEADLADQAFMHTLASAKIISSTKSIVFTGNEDSLSRIHTLVTSMDRAPSLPKQEVVVFVYKVQYVDPEYVENALQNLGTSMPLDDPLAQTINKMKYLSESRTLIFRGPEAAITHIKQILPTLDNVATAQENRETKTTYFVYQLHKASGEDIVSELEQTAKTLTPSTAQNKAIIESLNHVKWIQSTNSLILTGTSPVINRLKEIITTLDVQRPEKSSFYVYTPTISPQIFKEHLLDTANEMENAGLADNDLMHTMMSAKLVSHNSAVMFTGTPNGIQKLKEIIHTFDSLDATPNEFFIYTPHSISVDQLKEEILTAATQMGKSGLQDAELLNALKSIKTESSTKRVIFTGTVAAIEKVKVMVNIYDSQEIDSSEKPSTYYIFKPAHQSPESIIKQAQHAAAGMKQSNFTNPTLIHALESAMIVSKGTGVLFTGTSQAIEQIKTIISTFDSTEIPTSQVSKFFAYTPTHISAELLQQYTQKVATHMESTGFTDQDIINTLTHTRLISNNKALLFTGTPQALKEIQALLPSLDTTEESTKKIKETTFIIYKIQHIPGSTLMGFLRNMANDFRNTGSQQESLITVLNNMRYVKDTNSIIFTGETHAIQSAVALAKQFDIPELGQQKLATHTPSGFLLYKPKYLSGDDLIKALHDFKQNLVNSDVVNQELFDTINNVKWLERTSSILISGEEEDTQKVLDLLERFDTPGANTLTQQPEIATFSDTSFLIYKLQYHSGNDIQNAIKKIGDDLSHEKSTNANFIKTIQTLQWVEVTNSLIATGQSSDLGRLKALIQSIDTPLKQVFVEVLAIETTVGNQLTYGLRWGAQGTYKNKLAFGTYATPQSTKDYVDPLVDFNTKLHSVSATTTPKGEFIPVASGCDLGVIGDVILHKGTTYLALGSLVNAVRTEGDTTIVMNQKIITQDNKKSTIFIGQNLPYSGSFVSNTGSRTIQTTNIEYRDVGVSLSITPTVGNNDVITLEIEEDISEATNSIGAGFVKSTGHIGGIITAKTTTKTVASVPDKSFLILSGSIQDSTTHSRTGIPCLGGLPLIGAAFSESGTGRNIHNIIIFVRPQIIKGFSDYSTITEQQENIFRSQARSEDFDAGLELVKTPDDSY